MFRLIFFLFFIKSFVYGEGYNLYIRDMYVISLTDRPVVGDAKSIYINRLNINPIILELPSTRVTRIIENFFTLWSYKYYTDANKKYETISIFNYKKKEGTRHYFFHLNTLIQMDQDTKQFIKVTYYWDKKELIFQRGYIEVHEIEDSKESNN